VIPLTAHSSFSPRPIFAMFPSGIEIKSRNLDRSEERRIHFLPQSLSFLPSFLFFLYGLAPMMPLLSPFSLIEMTRGPPSRRFLVGSYCCTLSAVNETFGSAPNQKDPSNRVRRRLIYIRDPDLLPAFIFGLLLSFHLQESITPSPSLLEA